MSNLEPQSPIRVFLAVCQAGSFAKAADGLALTASAIAKTIARLEARLQVRLFDRTTRRLSLTREGQTYQEACLRATDDIDRVEASLAQAASVPSGTLRVSLPPLFGTQVIAPVLYGLGERYPALAFDISLDIERVDLLARGIDLAVRIGELPDVTGLTARRLGTQGLVMCASAGYVEQHGEPATKDDLAGHALITTTHRGQAVPWQLTDAEGRIESWSPPSRLRTDSSMLTLAAVRAGRGIGLLPRWLVADDLAAGRLRALMAERLAGHLPIHALWLTAPVMLPRLRVAIDAIVDAV
ncbi:LysR family transcriptional regulator [Variovorax sp. PAMC26660]|uniref:LysR family transcriptional regulator n=1 Tax=Variovorax sp. PAMC26660 TaxID=2762322 RepID=UPI00164D5410|nr:LysR family transcriptional regulator [Variovorax sp. PAMC26660]QNK67020.1 LysR family transcriptional regulator [Variovorax sp. PAMC26660]